MTKITNKQTFVFSVNLNIQSTMNTEMNLQFAADELVVKAISYQSNVADVGEVIQIWCNITNDNLIGSFPNSGPAQTPIFIACDTHLQISNSFQTGTFTLQFQETGNNGTPSPFYYNPQDPIANNSNGVVSITIEFVKHEK